MTLQLHALGVTIDVHVEDPHLGDVLAQVLRDLTAPDRAGDAPHPVTVSGRGPWHVTSAVRTSTATTPEQALSGTLTAVNLTAVAATPLLAFHAAVVTRHGSALVVPARSGAGKSTLTTCLLRQGWAYVSDEALALDWSSGRLSAYPRPMALSPWSCQAAGGVTGLPGDGETVVTAADAGAPVDLEPGPVRHVVLLKRGPTRSVSIAPVDRNDGLHELLQRGFTHHQEGGTALLRMAELLSGSRVLELTLGDPVAAATSLTRLADSG